MLEVFVHERRLEHPDECIAVAGPLSIPGAHRSRPFESRFVPVVQRDGRIESFGVT